MGLSIHYSGKISNTELIRDFIEEVDEICTAFNWQTTIIQDEVIDGIVFAPNNCEPLFFTFAHNGEMLSPVLLELEIEPANSISVKTQYAGIDAHMAVIKLLRYLNKKYFSEFTLWDEGHYWETDDKKILQKQFSRFETALGILTVALETLPTIENESAESLAERIEHILKKGKE